MAHLAMHILAPLLVSLIPVIMTILSLIIRNHAMGATALSINLIISIVVIWLGIWWMIWNRDGYWSSDEAKRAVMGLLITFFILVVLATVLMVIYEAELVRRDDDKDNGGRNLGLGIVAFVFYFICFLMILSSYFLTRKHLIPSK